MQRQTSSWALAFLLSAATLFAVGCGDDGGLGGPGQDAAVRLDAAVGLDAGRDGGSGRPDAGPEDGGSADADAGLGEVDGGSGDPDGGSEEPDGQVSITITSFQAAADKVQAGQTLEITWAVTGPAKAEVTLLRGSTELYKGSDLNHQFTTPAWLDHADLSLKVTSGRLTEQASLSVVVEPVIKRFKLDTLPFIGESATLSYEVAGPLDTTVKLVEGSATVWEVRDLSGTGETPLLEGPTGFALRAESSRGGAVVSEALPVTPAYKFVNTATTSGGMNRSEQSFDLAANRATSVYIPPYATYRGLSYRIEGAGTVTGPTKHIYVRKAVQGTETATRTYKINEGAVEGTVFDLEADAAYVVTLDTLDDITDFKLMTLPSVYPDDFDKMIGVMPDPANRNHHIVTSCIERKDAQGNVLSATSCQNGVITQSFTMDSRGGVGILKPYTTEGPFTLHELMFENATLSISPNLEPTRSSIYLEAMFQHINSHGAVLDSHAIRCQARDLMGFIIPSVWEHVYISTDWHVLKQWEFHRVFSVIQVECELRPVTPIDVRTIVVAAMWFKWEPENY